MAAGRIAALIVPLDLSRWPDADDLLDAALALPSDDRVAFVRRQAASPELAGALEAVLAEADRDDAFLNPDRLWSGPLGGALEQEINAETPALEPGFALEHYEVIGPLGRGGMGEVYRARDTRLARDVALKVLPARYAGDPERRARFNREARVLAAVNHSGIAAIYGVAEAADVEALVLELVEGPTLAETLSGGPLPLDQVLALAAQLVDALGAAHARGILHRDLKPANIKITSRTTAKILDFGLARMLAQAEGEADDANLTRQSRPALLGTVSYMSPEQARGHAVDTRADIWAFGCVLFEMLTGKRAFSGATTTDVLAAVVDAEPPFAALPRSTPEPLRRLLRRCLDKDRERRLGFIGDARFELEESTTAPSAAATARAGSSVWPTGAALLVVGLVAGVSAAALYLRGRPVDAPAVSRLVMPFPAADRPITGFQPVAALSPDGRTLVYRAARGETAFLFRRELGALGAEPIAGTENGTGPFFSPDGRWLAFDADGVLKRVAMAGGTPVAICNAPGGVTGAWLRDDTIVFATNTTRVLQVVPASGGTPTPVSALDASRGDTLHLLPQELPDGAVLFTIATGPTRRVAILDRTTGAVQEVGEGSHAQYLDDGYLIFARDGALWAGRFDARGRRFAGSAVPLDERVANSDSLVFHYAVAGGTLAYLPPQSASSRQRVAWIDRGGRETPVEIEPRPYTRMSLAPDGTRVAFAIEEDGNTDVWIADPARHTMIRLTSETTIETMPTWAPNGRHVAFRSERGGPGIFRRDAQGSGELERLTLTDGPIHSPYSWTPDGRTLLLAVFRSFRSQAIASVTPPETKLRILLDGEFAQLDPQVSPNGQWLAYQSDETGRFEIYVRPYPEVGSGRWLISTNGGTTPRWSPDGRELFYYDGAALMRVAVEGGLSFAAGRPSRLFAVTPFGGRLGPDLEVSPDGQRFLFLLPGPPAPAAASGLVFVQNWIEEVRARLSR